MNRRTLLLLLSVVALGCSRATEVIGYDSTTARQTLVTALEAWKNGQAASLAGRQPPIRFVDDDWSAGLQLVNYQLQQPETPIRPFEPVFVDLRLRTHQGKIVQRTAGYQIHLQPRLAVLRADS